MSRLIRPVSATLAAAVALVTLSPATFATQQAPRSSVPPEWGAQGGPIYRPCDSIAGAITQMRTGMATQEGWLRSAEAQLRAAENGALESEQARRDFFFNHLQDFALGQLQEVATLKRKVKLLETVGLDKEARRRVLALEKKAERVNKLADELLKKQREADAEFDYSKKLRENKAELMDLLKMAEETGMAEHLVSTLAMAGPFGKLAAESGKLVIDASLLAYGSVISEEELRRARADLNLLRETHKRNLGIISDLEQERADAMAAGQCPGASPSQGQQQAGSSLTPPLPDPPAAAPPPNATPVPKPAPKPEKKGSGMSDALFYGGLGGLVGVAYLYSEYGKAGEQCTPPAQNVLTVCSSQGGSSAACQSAVAAQKAYCSCLGLGYSGGNCTG